MVGWISFFFSFLVSFDGFGGGGGGDYKVGSGY